MVFGKSLSGRIRGFGPRTGRPACSPASRSAAAPVGVQCGVLAECGLLRGPDLEAPGEGSPSVRHLHHTLAWVSPGPASCSTAETGGSGQEVAGLGPHDSQSPPGQAWAPGPRCLYRELGPRLPIFLVQWTLRKRLVKCKLLGYCTKQSL